MKSVSAQSALSRLKNGNKKFVADKLKREGQHRERREELENGQFPFAVVLSCADSRVVPELVLTPDWEICSSFVWPGTWPTHRR